MPRSLRSSPPAGRRAEGSVAGDVGKAAGGRFDRVARLEEDAGRAPGPGHELAASTVRHAHRDRALAEAHLAALEVERELAPGLAAHGALEPLDVGHVGRDARDPEGRAVAEEDLRK